MQYKVSIAQNRLYNLRSQDYAVNGAKVWYSTHFRHRYLHHIEDVDTQEC